MSIQPLTVDKFSGGITDFVDGSRTDQFVLGENLLIDRSGTPFSRWGSRLFDEANGRPAGITSRIGTIWNFDEEVALFIQNARKVWRYAAGWSELTGPSGNPVFGVGTVAGRTSSFQWRGKLYVTNDEASSVMKIYRTAAATFQVRNAGLPAFDTEALYSQATAGAPIAAMAVAIRAAMLAHYANTTTTVHAVPGGAATPDVTAAALITLTDVVTGDSLATTIAKVSEYMLAYRAHYTDAVKSSGTRSYHANTYVHPGAPNSLLAQAAPPTTFLAVAQVLNDLKLKHNWHVRSHRGHFNTTALDTYGRPTAAVGGANHQVSVADLTGTEEGPLFTDLSYASLIASVNIAKAAFNSHLLTTGTNMHGGGLMETDAADTESIITLADATDKNSAFEMVAHFYSGYRLHHEDAALPTYLISGTGTFPANTDRIAAVAGTTDTSFSLASLTAGMWLNFVDKTGTGPTWAPTKGLKIGTVDVPNQRITVVTGVGVAAPNDGSGVTGGTVIGLHVSAHKYHREGYTALTASEKAAGLLSDVDFATYARDLETVVDTFNDTVLKFNSHDDDYGRDPAAAPTRPHLLNGGNQIADQGLVVYRYGYGFIFSYEYTTVSGETFRDVSKPFLKTKVALRSVEDSPSSFTGLASIVNGGTENYDTGVIKIEVYRTENDRTVLRLVGSTLNGVDTFVDAVGDAELASNEAIYTSGGVVDADPPPKAKFIHMVGDFAYYGNILSDPLTSEVLPHRIRQAVGGSPDQCPGDFFVDLAGAVKGLSSVKQIPVAWTDDGTLRLQGTFNELGQGGIIAVPISNRIGLAGSSSPVQVDGGIVFAGSDQFYFTDGYTLRPLGQAWPDTYLGITSTTQRKANIVGAFDKLTDRLFFAATSTGTENNRAFVLDMNHPAGPDTGACFTAWSNGDSFAPTSLAFFGGQLIRGDARGYVFKHDVTYTSDPAIIAAGAVTGFMKTITYQYRSARLPMGPRPMRVWASFIEAQFDNQGDLSAQWKVLNDEGRTSGSCTPMRIRNLTGLIDEKRYFPARSLWGSTKQIELTNAYVGIANSDTLGTATVTAGTTVTIDAGTFPADMVDHKIAFGPLFTTEYTITNQNGGNTVLTVAAAVNGANQKWVIRGYPKTETMALDEYSVWWAAMGVNQSTARGESGENT